MKDAYSMQRGCHCFKQLNNAEDFLFFFFVHVASQIEMVHGPGWAVPLSIHSTCSLKQHNSIAATLWSNVDLSQNLLSWNSVLWIPLHLVATVVTYISRDASILLLKQFSLPCSPWLAPLSFHQGREWGLWSQLLFWTQCCCPTKREMRSC